MKTSLINKRMTTAKDITETLLSMSDEKQREVLCRFFKTGKGEYGEGDRFIGLRVPQTLRYAIEKMEDRERKMWMLR